MRKAADYLDMADRMFTDAVQRSLMQQMAEDEAFDGRTVRHQGRELINFGSCSYLGLEVDPRLKRGAIDAVMSYGTQFSCSRAYISAPLYGELEDLFAELFGMPVLVAPTTSLMHMAALPVLIHEDDAIILDQQVHSSVQTATNLVRTHGTRVEIIRHNRMDMLEDWIRQLRGHVRRIWYMADGLYSMFGDFAPIEALHDLLERYEQFHVYIDDAHGMSWYGQHGRGYVLDQKPLHERMVVATSLAKAFGVCGGLLVTRNAEFRRRVRTVGGGMVFSGPIQPANLGASIASARIHLSDEINQLQADLQMRIQLCNRLISDYGLPVVDACTAPIRFIGTGLPRVTYNMVARLMADGMLTNVSMFPLVPMKRSGIRFTLTNHHTPDDIHRLIAAIAHHLPEALAEEGSSFEELYKAFDLEERTAVEQPLGMMTMSVPASGLRLQHETSITALPQEEWDRLLGGNGSFTWEGLRFLEAAYRGHSRPEDNWNFHYYVIRDENDIPVLATFCTEALWKDDMIASEEVSRQVEQRRVKDPHYLTSRTFAMGSLLTEGDHLYLDRSGDWQTAMKLLLQEMSREQERCGAVTLALRDLPADDPQMDDFLMSQGLAKFLMPDSLLLEIDWQDEAGYFRKLSPKSRWHQRHEVLPWADAVEIEELRMGGRRPSPEEFAHMEQLYRHVKDRSLIFNTFDLPPNLFERMLEHPGWVIKLMRLRPEHGGSPDRPPIGVSADYIGPSQYVPLVIGLDYDYVRSHRTYRQALRQVIKDAERHGARRVYFGMGATLEKRRFGATVTPRAVYFQASDHYHMEVLAQLMANNAGAR